MKEKFMRFMQGRYGVLDTLGKVLLVLGLVLAFFAPVFSGDHVIGMVFYLFGWGCLIYAYFRMFSRNVRKRYDENVRFLNKTAKIRGFFKSQKNLMAQRKDYHIYTCPGCKQKIRIPRGKGKIEIRCPKCGTTFIKKS